MIDFREQSSFVREVVETVTHVRHPTSCNLVIPISFGGNRVADLVAEALRQQHPALPVAVISIDTINSTDTYAHELALQWAGRPHGLRDEDLVGMPLGTLLGGLQSPAIQVIKRFDKFADVLNYTALAVLRDFEQQRRVFTITVSPFDYNELKARWRRNHPVTVSDYGDQHRRMAAVEVQDDSAIIGKLREDGVPEHIAEYVIGLTGGYPETTDAVIEHWFRGGEESALVPKLRVALREEATMLLRRFVDKLDRPGLATYRDAIIDLHHGCDPDPLVEVIAAHPWSRILLDGDALRASCVGEAAVRQVIEQSQHGSHSQHELIERAAAFYRRRQYRHAAELLERHSVPRPSLRVRFLSAHANIMRLLYGEGCDYVGSETSWGHLPLALGSAESLLKECTGRVRNAEILADRYKRLKELAAVVSRAIRHYPERCVDALAGLQGGEETKSVTAAYFMMCVCLRHGRMSSDGNIACSILLPLPEQTLRIWAFHSCGINFYRSTAMSATAWDTARDEFGKQNRGTLDPVPEGHQFPDAFTLAYATHARVLETGAPSLFDDWGHLHNDLSTFAGTRTPKAHAVGFPPKELQKKYAELAERWLKRLFDVCPIGCTMAQLEAIGEPLPLVDSEGNLGW